MDTKDVGRVYFTLCRLNRGWLPLKTKTESNEIEEPYRQGTGVAFRISPSWGLVIGVWKKDSSTTEYKALLRALGGRQFEADNIGEWNEDAEEDCEGATASYSF